MLNVTPLLEQGEAAFSATHWGDRRTLHEFIVAIILTLSAEFAGRLRRRHGTAPGRRSSGFTVAPSASCRKRSAVLQRGAGILEIFCNGSPAIGVHAGWETDKKKNAVADQGQDSDVQVFPGRCGTIRDTTQS
jgi:hypothetical protein